VSGEWGRVEMGGSDVIFEVCGNHEEFVRLMYLWGRYARLLGNGVRLLKSSSKVLSIGAIA
jgi:hypothetical protein